MARRCSSVAAALLLLGAAGILPTAPASGREAGRVEVRRDVRHDTSLPLAVIAERPGQTTGPVPVRAPLRRELPPEVAERAAGSSRAPSATTPSLLGGPTISFEGVSNADNQAVGEALGVPPDTVGDMGPEHYVQMTNVVTKVFDRDGNVLLGPVKNSSFWNGLGGLCENTNQGDPIVLFDPLVDNPSGAEGRWVVSQFAFDLDVNGDPDPPFHQCVAVSATGDPTGSYHQYDFFWSNNEFNDYPKLGVWPNAYFLSVNEFSGPSMAFDSAAVAALERSAMLQGQAADLIEIDLEGISPNSFTLLPSDMDGSTPPPFGSPNYLFELRDNVFWGPPVGLHAWKFDVDFATPANSTLTGPQIVNTDDYDIMICEPPQYPLCVPQPGTSARLDVLSDRLMHRNAYRNFGTHESLVLSHSVRVETGGTARSGIAWYEIRNPASNPPTVSQQGTVSPNTVHRWMPSIAMNEVGRIAVGYSASSSSVFPSIRYSGRSPPDPAGSMAQEATLMAGSGSQTHSSGRWGDYSAMSVDPFDEQTFWYTNEYYATTSQRGWNTRIGAFSITQTEATCLGEVATIVGTSGSDQIIGTPGDDVIVSQGGADDIEGLEGQDLVCAGAGADEVDGGEQADTVLGQAGRDDVAGRDGRDDLRGGDDDDELKGNRGDDDLLGGPDDDLLNGGLGTDDCGGGPGQDQLVACES
jgi:hypothetical protein